MMSQEPLNLDTLWKKSYHIRINQISAAVQIADHLTILESLQSAVADAHVFKNQEHVLYSACTRPYIVISVTGNLADIYPAINLFNILFAYTQSQHAQQAS